MKKLFIDDERIPATDDWCIVRSSEDAIKWISKNGIPSYISFDHDLGGEDNSMIIVNWIVEQVLDEKLFFPESFDFYVHSQNPVGKENIENLLTNLLTYIEEEL